jgi:hypothetical protein
MINVSKKFLITVMAFLCITSFAQSWLVEYRVPESNTAENYIRANFKIINNSGSSVPLGELTIRYWYTSEGTGGDVLECWWAQVGSSNVKGAFVDVSPAVTGADRYCEVSFLSGAGSIQNGSDSGEIQCGIRKETWTDFNETDDYSYDGTKTSYTAWENVTLYHNGTLVWGIEAVGGITAEPTPVPTPTPELTPVPTMEGYGEGILLEAEDYDTFYDTSSGNAGNVYRNDDVDIESCSEGGFNVGWIESGEWLEYNFAVGTADAFDIYVRVASPSGKTDGFYIVIDGTDAAGWVAVPNTCSWQAWGDAVVEGIQLTAGVHSLRIVLNGSLNFNYIYLSSKTILPAPTEVPGASQPTSTPPPGYVGPANAYGRLQVIGTSLSDSNGNPVQLKGMNSHGLQWFPFVKDHTVANLAYDWHIDIVRPAMYVEDYKDGNFWGGYILQPDYMKQKVTEIADDAIEAGIYVIFDWHIHNNPLNFKDEAVEFFTEMAAAYGTYPNILYEICNEPEYVDWDTVKIYANEVIPAIRSIDPDNIILVGTPSWSQDVDVAADSPLTGYTNIMYTLHFYAGSHHQSYRDKADYALGKGLPVFVSEWGASDCYGGTDGQVYLSEAQTWLDWIDSHNVSWINWNFSNKGEASAALLPGISIGGPWADDDLTESGNFIKNKIASYQNPTGQPDETPSPTSVPTQQPTDEPTIAPTDVPTSVPTSQPTSVPTDAATNQPTVTPTPTQNSTSTPSPEPTQPPTSVPTGAPTQAPTGTPVSGQTTLILSCVDGFNQKEDRTLSSEGKESIVRESDDEYVFVESGYWISFAFDTIPPETDVSSVKIYIEHWEEGYMGPELRVGPGTLQNPGSIASTNLTLRMSERNQATDVWDITGFVTTPGDINDMKVVFKNTSWWSRSYAVDKIEIRVECD